MTIDWEELKQYLLPVKAKMEERPYQVTATERAWGSKRCVVDGKPGSGKTLIVWTATLLQKPNRVLILCSKNALGTWKKELNKWFPYFEQFYTILDGTPTQRQVFWSKRKTAKRFVACTYAIAQRDIEMILKSHESDPFDVLIMDEYQKAGLLTWKGKGKDAKGKERTTVGFRTIAMLGKHVKSMFPTSGTTTKKGPQHLWPILNILNPDMFPAYWKFVYRFCVVVDAPFGKQICGPQNQVAMTETIKPHYHRIPRKETDKYLPAINRQIIPIKMQPLQADLYKQVDEQMWYEMPDGTIQLTPTILAKITKLRQIMVSPQILYPKHTEIGTIAETIVDMIRERGDHHTVIFTPFRPAVLLLKEYFKKELKLPDDEIFHIWGGTEPDELRATEKAWKRTKGLVLATTLFAQSYELDTTDFCFFAGYECEHTDNEQCEGRVRRITNPRPINAYYLQHEGTYDEHWLDILCNKKRSVKLTFSEMEEAKQRIGGNYGHDVQKEEAQEEGADYT